MNRTRARIEKMMAIKINIHVNTSYKLSASCMGPIMCSYKTSL